MIRIPLGKELRINVNAEPITSQKMIIEEDIAFSLSSTFSPLLSGGNTKLIDLVGGISKELTTKGFSGQFKQMGIQVWGGTAPLSLKITVGFYLDKEKPNGRTQVYEPALALAKLPLPEEIPRGNLIPPGPTLLSSILGKRKGKGAKIISVEVGKILYLQNALIKAAEPIFSNETDINNYPIWSKVSLSITSMMAATTAILDNKG